MERELFLVVLLVLSAGCAAKDSSYLINQPEPQQQETAGQAVVQDNNAVATNAQDNNLGAEDATRGYRNMQWKKLVTDGNIYISPPGFIRLERREAPVKIVFLKDYGKEMRNVVFEWRVKIIKGTFTGFPLVVKFFTPSEKLLKVEHAVDRTLLTGKTISKFGLDLNDYRVFKLVFNRDQNADFFADGNMLYSGKEIISRVPLIESSGFYVEKRDSNISIDYFYADLDNDGKWDMKEDWEDLNNLS